MNPDKQRIAIAEACGWTSINRDMIDECICFDGNGVMREGIPDYLNDLNSVKEARNTLNKDEQTQFIHHLENIVSRKSDANLWSWALVDSSPMEQSEAFLKTKMLWGE